MFWPWRRPEQKPKGGSGFCSWFKHGRLRLNDGDTRYGMGDKCHAIESEDNSGNICAAKNLAEEFEIVHGPAHIYLVSGRPVGHSLFI